MRDSARRNSTDRAARLQKRLSRFGGRTADFICELPDSKFGRHLYDQLLRSASAPGAHYAEARSAQSRADFIHKLALAGKEMRESVHWLEFAAGSERIDIQPDELLEEADELVAILFQSLQTARTDIEE